MVEVKVKLGLGIGQEEGWIRVGDENGGIELGCERRWSQSREVTDGVGRRLEMQRWKKGQRMGGNTLERPKLFRDL